MKAKLKTCGKNVGEKLSSKFQRKLMIELKVWKAIFLETIGSFMILLQNKKKKVEVVFRYCLFSGLEKT